MTEDGLLARPASDSWKSASMAPEGKKESDGSLVIVGWRAADGAKGGTARWTVDNRVVYFGEGLRKVAQPSPGREQAIREGRFAEDAFRPKGAQAGRVSSHYWREIGRRCRCGRG